MKKDIVVSQKRLTQPMGTTGITIVVMVTSALSLSAVVFVHNLLMDNAQMVHRSQELPAWGVSLAFAGVALIAQIIFSVQLVSGLRTDHQKAK